MDACKFNVFQHPADDDMALAGILELPNVGDAIHIHFRGVFQEFVHQHRSFRRCFHGEAHIMLQLTIRIDDLHRAPAEDE